MILSIHPAYTYRQRGGGTSTVSVVFFSFSPLFFFFFFFQRLSFVTCGYFPQAVSPFLHVTFYWYQHSIARLLIPSHIWLAYRVGLLFILGMFFWRCCLLRCWVCLYTEWHLDIVTLGLGLGPAHKQKGAFWVSLSFCCCFGALVRRG